MQVAKELTSEIIIPPSIGPFNGTRLLLLRFLMVNKVGYASQIAKYCKITTARASQILKELEALKIVESTSREMDCRYCNSTGRKNFGTKQGICIFCKGTGRMKEKTYPLFYRISGNCEKALLDIFKGISSITLNVAKEKAEAPEQP